MEGTKLRIRKSERGGSVGHTIASCEEREGCVAKVEDSGILKD